MAITYAQPNLPVPDFLNPAIVKAPKPVQTPEFNAVNPFSQDSFINRNTFLGPNANSTPQFAGNMNISATPGSVAAIQQPTITAPITTPTTPAKPGTVAKTIPTTVVNSTLPTGWDALTYANFKKANPTLEPDAQDTFMMQNAGKQTIPGSTIAVPNYVAPAITAEQQRVLDAQAIQEQTNQVLDPETLYQQKLARQQSEIDTQNNIYNDMINQSRINNAAKYKGRIESRQFAQGRAGQIGSGTGEAGINAVQDANTQEQNAAEALINEQRNQKIAGIMGQIRQSAEAEAIANKEARMKGADAIVSNAALRATTRAKTAANAVKGLLAAGVDLKNMTEAEKKTYLDGIGISSTDWNAIVGTETSAIEKAKQDSVKAESELAKTKAETSNLIGKNDFEAAQKALDRQLEQKKIDVQWYNAESSRISSLKKDSTSTEKNYDAKTIPSDVKKELFSDITSNANMGGTFSGTKKKTLNEFITAYPEINTDYLTALYEANQ